MNKYESLTKAELTSLLNELEANYDEIKSKGLNLDMSRGKPSPEQLDLSNELLKIDIFTAKDGMDCRNYGGLTGITEARQLFAEMLDVPAENVMVAGNSSLNMMYDMLSRSVTHGVMGKTPWCKLNKVKFLCPVPGYDRHFKMSEFFGFEMINIPIKDTGPDMDLVEKYVSEDAEIKGIWCVPKYSNPQGISYSDETVRRFARLKPAAPDFRIIWDNAYAVHHFDENNHDVLLNLFAECEKAGNPDLLYVFGSFSKISFAGAGISAIGASKANLDFIQKSLANQTIGFDKINMLRHVEFFKDLSGIKSHMKKHAAIIAPKFTVVLSCLTKQLSGLDIAKWQNPKGGYFISFETLPGCAKQVISLCKGAGVIMTEAGAAFPYGIDPNDSNIRIAPSFLTEAELETAMELFVICVKLASVQKLIGA